MVAVVGGRGGAGATTLACALAVTAARAGRRVLLVDGDPLGGGIDLVFGGEGDRGLRWPDLEAARGAGCRRARWPTRCRGWPGCRCCPGTAGAPAAVPAEAMVGGARRGPARARPRRGRPAARASTTPAGGPRSRRPAACCWSCPAELRAAAAAGRVAARLAVACHDLRLVVRGPGPGRARRAPPSPALLGPAARRASCGPSPASTRRWSAGEPPGAPGPRTARRPVRAACSTSWPRPGAGRRERPRPGAARPGPAPGRRQRRRADGGGGRGRAPAGGRRGARRRAAARGPAGARAGDHRAPARSSRCCAIPASPTSWSTARTRSGSTGAGARAGRGRGSPARTTVRRLAQRLAAPERPPARRRPALGRRRAARRRAPARGPAADRAARHLPVAARPAPARLHAGRAGRPAGSVPAGRRGPAAPASWRPGSRSWSPGGTGSGKTTLLSALLGLVDPADRLLLVEDSAELRPRPPARRPAGGPAAQPRGRRRGHPAATWSARRCGCGRTGSSSARSAAPRSSTCSPRSTPGTRAGAAPCTPTPRRDVPARLEALAATAGLPRDALHSQLAAGPAPRRPPGARARRAAPGRRGRRPGARPAAHVTAAPGWVWDGRTPPTGRPGPRAGGWTALLDGTPAGRRRRERGRRRRPGRRGGRRALGAPSPAALRLAAGRRQRRRPAARRGAGLPAVGRRAGLAAPACWCSPGRRRRVGLVAAVLGASRPAPPAGGSRGGRAGRARRGGRGLRRAGR